MVYSLELFLQSIHIYKVVCKRSFDDRENYHKEKVGDIPKPSPENDYWKNFLKKKCFYDLTKEDGEEILDVRIRFIQNYYERFFSGKLTDKELNKPKPKNYKGPYLPIPKEIEAISDLNIHIDWDVPTNQTSLNQTPGIYKLNFEHRELIFRRWLLFQKEYHIYDLRPLIGERCGVIYNSIDSDEQEFVFYKLLNKQQYRNFLIYLSKVTPDLNLHQVFKLITFSICDAYEDGKLRNNCFVYCGGLEYRLMYEIYNRFGERLMIERYSALLIGKRVSFKYKHINNGSGYFRNMSFTDCPWTGDQSLELLKIVKEFSSAPDMKTFLIDREKLPWRQIFYKYKTRKSNLIQNHFIRLRQRMLDAVTKREKGAEANLRWTAEQTIKLIELVYDEDAKSIRDINWHKIVKHFPGHSASFINQIFGSLIRLRVPSKTRRYFEDLMEYLYHQIKPIYILNDVPRKERKNQIELLVGIESTFHNDIIEDIFFERDKNVVICSSSGWGNSRSNAKSTQNSRQNLAGFSMYIEDDESFWWRLMDAHGFQYNYSPSLHQKLRYVIETDTESEDEALERPSTSSANRSDFNKNNSNNKVRFGRRRTGDASRNSENGREFSGSSENVPKLSTPSCFVVDEQNDRENEGNEREIMDMDNFEDFSMLDEVMDSLMFSSEDEVEEFTVRKKKSKRKKRKKNNAEDERSSNNANEHSEPDIEILKATTVQNTHKREDSEREKSLKKHVKHNNDALNKHVVASGVDDFPEGTVKKKSKKKKHERNHEHDTETNENQPGENERVNHDIVEYILNPAVQNCSESPVHKHGKKSKRDFEYKRQSNNNWEKDSTGCSDVEYILNSSHNKPSKNITVKKHKDYDNSKRRNIVSDNDQPTYSVIDYILDPTVTELPDSTSVTKKKKKKHKRNLEDSNQPKDIIAACEGDQASCNVIDYILDPAISELPDSAIVTKKKKKKKHKRDLEDSVQSEDISSICEDNQASCSIINYILSPTVNEGLESSSVIKHKNRNRGHELSVDKDVDDSSKGTTVKKHKKRKLNIECSEQMIDLETHYEDSEPNCSGLNIFNPTETECLESFTPFRKRKKRIHHYECNIADEILDINAKSKSKTKSKSNKNQDDEINKHTSDLEARYDDNQPSCNVIDYILSPTPNECSESSPVKKHKNRNRGHELNVADETVDNSSESTTVKKHKKKRKPNLEGSEQMKDLKTQYKDSQPSCSGLQPSSSGLNIIFNPTESKCSESTPAGKWKKRSRDECNSSDGILDINANSKNKIKSKSNKNHGDKANKQTSDFEAHDEHDQPSCKVTDYILSPLVNEGSETSSVKKKKKRKRDSDYSATDKFLESTADGCSEGTIVEKHKEKRRITIDKQDTDLGIQCKNNEPSCSAIDFILHPTVNDWPEIVSLKKSKKHKGRDESREIFKANCGQK